MSTKIVCWNIAKRHEPWRQLVEMDADLALLQEAGRVPEDVGEKVDTGPEEHWDSHVWNSRWYADRWNALYDRWPMVVKLSDRVKVEWFKQISPISIPALDEIPVSGIGTIAAARVTPQKSKPFTVVSMYARWIAPHPSVKTSWTVGFPDGSAHRIISDLSTFIGSTDPASHRILAAGDLNMSLDASHRDPFTSREGTVVDRMAALGFERIGPVVPTYHTIAQTPATAGVLLDHVFASRGFHTEVTVNALNSVEEWGASDHCRLWIGVRPVVS